MKNTKLRILTFMMMCTLMVSMSDCEQHAGNAPTYVDAAGKVYTLAQDGSKEYQEAKTGVEKAKVAVDAIRDTASIVTAVVPGAQGISTAVVAVATAISGILAVFAIKKNKDVKVEKARAESAEAKADDYGEAIEAGIMHGNSKSVVDVQTMKDVLNTETKSHFNAKGATRL